MVILQPTEPSQSTPLAQVERRAQKQETALTRAQLLKRAMHFTLAALAFLLVAEALARGLAVSRHAQQSHYRLYELKYHIATQPVEKGKKLVLFAGDSLMTFAAFPELIAARLQEQGMPADVRNIAVQKNTPKMALALLKASVESGNRPEHVYFNLSMRNMDARYSDEDKNFEKSYLNRCRLNRPADSMSSAVCTLERNLYLARYRNHFKTWLTNLGGVVLNPDAHDLSRPSMEYHPVEEFSRNGWVPNYTVNPKPEVDKLFKTRYERYINGKEPIPSDIPRFVWTDKHLLPVLAYCKQEELPLTIVLLPDYPYPELFYKVRGTTRQAFVAQNERLAKRWGARFLDLKAPGVASTDFSDDSHLNTRGAVAASEAFAVDVARRLRTAE